MFFKARYAQLESPERSGAKGTQEFFELAHAGKKAAQSSNASLPASNDDARRRLRIRVCLVGVLLLAVAAVVIWIVKTNRHRQASVMTGCGPVTGRDEGSATVYKGIPYAKPPTNSSRWLPPQSLESAGECWHGTFQALDFKPPCVQLDVNNPFGSEDCLTLNVFRPNRGARLQAFDRISMSSPLASSAFGLCLCSCNLLCLVTRRCVHLRRQFG